MTSLFRSLALLTALATAAASPGQEAPPAEDQSTIVVTGERNSEKAVRDFVGALTRIPSFKQLGRFEQPVCPIALGLPAAQEQAVAARIKRLAKEAEIAVGGASCAPNVVVLVTDDKALLMKELRNRHPHYFGDLSQREIRKLARLPGPAVAWQLRGAPVSARGVELFYDESQGYYVNKTTEAASRLHNGTRPQFAGAVVVVERGALGGLTVTQLADYAAIRALTGADPARLGASSAPTILRVLEAPMGTAVPVTLTRWDLGFLRGYYSTPRNLHTAAQQSAIGKSLEKELDTNSGE